MSEAPDTSNVEAPNTSLTGAEAAPAAEGQGGAEGQQSPEGGQGEGAAASGQGTAEGEAGAAGETTPGEGAEGAAEGGEAQGAPEQYAAFTMPDDYELEAASLDAISAFAKEHKLPQAEAQKLVDLGVSMSQQMVKDFAQAASELPVPMSSHWSQLWSQQTAKDKEIGGDKLAETMGLAQRVCSTFATPGLVEFLNTTGLAHHPELVRFMHKVGRAVSEDTLVTSAGGEQRQPSPVDRDAARAARLYPQMAVAS